MPTNLTGSTIASTYDQLLHIDEGPTAEEKIVHSGTGVATALKLSTQSASVGNLRLNGNTISSTNTNGDIILTSNGTGEVTVSNINVLSGVVPFGVLAGRAYGQFSSLQDQTTAADTPVAATFDSFFVGNTGVSVVSNSQITFATAGVYEVHFNAQIANIGTVDHEVTFWLKQNGTDVTASASRLALPASSVNDTWGFAYTTMVSVTAGQYIEVYWAPDHADVYLDYAAAEPSTPFPRPAIPSIILTANRVG